MLKIDLSETARYAKLKDSHSVTFREGLIIVTAKDGTVAMFESDVAGPGKVTVAAKDAKKWGKKGAASLDTGMAETVSGTFAYVEVAEREPIIVENPTHTATIDGTVLRDLARFTSTDKSRPILTNVRAEIGNDTTTYAATDSYRLALDSRQTKNPAVFVVNIPATVCRWIPTCEVTLHVKGDYGSILFPGGNVSFYAPPTSYPNVESIVKKARADGYSTMVLPRVALAEALKTAGKAPLVVFTDCGPYGARMEVRAEYDGKAHYTTTVGAPGSGGMFGANPKYLAATLESCDQDVISLRVKTAFRPLTVEWDGGTVCHIVVPVRLDNDDSSVKVSE